MKQSERRLYWRRMADEYAASGLTQVAFAAQWGIRVKSLQRWRKRFREEVEACSLPAFVEVIADAVPAPPCCLQVVVPAHPVELLIGEDCVLYVTPGTPTDYVAELVVALRRCGAC
jgi:hypothetical protein